MPAAKSYFNCGAGVFPVVRRKGGKSVYCIEKLKRREPFAFYDISRLTPRRIEAGIVVGSRLEVVRVVVVAVSDDERLGAIEREGAVRFICFDDKHALPACDWKIARLAANRPFNVFAKSEKELRNESRRRRLAVAAAYGDRVGRGVYDFGEHFSAHPHASSRGDKLCVVASDGRSRNDFVNAVHMGRGMPQGDRNAKRLKPVGARASREIAARHRAAPVF